MDFYFAYQQTDTATMKSLMELSSNAVKPVSLDLGQKGKLSHILPVDTTVRRKAEAAVSASGFAVKSGHSVPEDVRQEHIPFEPLKFINPMNENLVAGKALVAHPDVILPAGYRNQTNYDWITILLVFCLLLFATVKIPYAKYLGHMFQSLFNYSTSARMFRERNYSLVHGAFRMDIYFYIIFSLFVYEALICFNIDLPVKNFMFFLFCLPAVTGYFLLKRLLYTMIGVVNKGLPETNEYWFNLNNYNRVLGLFLFPVVAILAFSPYFNPLFFVFVGLFLTASFYGMSLQRGILILLKKQFSIFYLFLYLCTLEFLPLLLIFKMVLA